jgi:serine/threonine-protein kinase
LLERIGSGGMGEVYAAEHTALGKAVVIKVLHRQLADQPGLSDRVRLEAQVLARLTSPHLVDVIDLGRSHDGRPYMVMERLVGRTLRDEVRERGPLPVREALEYARQMLVGLAAAHAAGIVHRDVKPQNVFLCEPAAAGGARTIKVLDFGIAKLLEGALGTLAPPAVPTQEGVSIGTPEYFSPEQARGTKVDPRSDVYSVGAVLYLLLTGRAPFQHRRGVAELVRAHAREEPDPPSTHRRGLARSIDRLVLEALAKDPEVRPKSALALAADIQEILRDGGLLEAALQRGHVQERTLPLPPADIVRDATLEPETLPRASARTLVAPLVVIASAIVFAVATAAVVVGLWR